MADDAQPPVVSVRAHDDVHVDVAEPHVELWMAGRYAPAWFDEAKKQAAIDDDTDDFVKPREIIFAVCAIESYLVEWVRDEVLKGNYQRLTHYFPTDKHSRRQGIVDRWQAVIKHLHKDGTITSQPDFGLPYWAEFRRLVEFRNGLLHGRASRPETNTQQSQEEKPAPTLQQLVSLDQGWAANVVATVIKKLHEALGTSPPKWITSPAGTLDTLP